MRLGITVKTLKNHFYYSWWKYMIVFVGGILGVSLLFDVTEYRAPKEKRIDLYCLNGYADTDRLRVFLWPLLHERCPEQEELNVLNIDLTSDDMYARMRYSTYIASGEGDVLLIPGSEYASLQESGEFVHFLVDLVPYIDKTALTTKGIDIEQIIVRKDGAEHIYGIPTDSLSGLAGFCDPTDTVMGITAHSKNKNTAAELISILIEAF